MKTTSIQQLNGSRNGLVEPFALPVPSMVVGGGRAEKKKCREWRGKSASPDWQKVSPDRCGRSKGNQKRKTEMTDKQLQCSTSYSYKEKQKGNASIHLLQPESTHPRRTFEIETQAVPRS